MPLDSGSSFVVDFTGVKDRSGFNPVHQEAGDYRGVIKDVNEGQATTSGNKLITYTIADAERPSATYRYSCTLTDKSLWKLRNLLVAAGVKVPQKKIKLTAAILSKIVGEEIGISLDDHEYEGKMSSEIVNVFPADDLPEDEPAPTPKVAAKKPAAKGKAAPAAEEAEEDEDEDLDELDIDEL